MPTGHAYSAGKFALEIAGTHACFLVSAAGGEAFATVVEDTPTGVRVPKHIGALGYAPIVVELVAPLASSVADWVSAMLDGTQTPTAGAIVMIDYSFKVRSRLEWAAALITEVGFPACDGASKDAARIRLTIQPDSTQLVASSGNSYNTTTSKQQKSASASNFRFELSGLEAASKKVAQVSSITVTRAVGAGVLDVADVTLRVAESESAPFAAWFDDFVIMGNNGAGDERTASLTLLDQTLKQSLLVIELEGVGVFRLSHERQEAGIEAIQRAKVELYCEAVRLGTPAAAPPDPPAPPPPAAPPTSADAMTALAQAVVAVLQQGTMVAPTVTPDAIADRLLASSEPTPPVGDFDRGRAAGRSWASDHARLDELEAIAELAERDDWKVLVLADGHSLLSFLARTGDLDVVAPGPVDLERDEFTSGLVAGVAEVHREVEPRLRERGRLTKPDE